MHLFSPESRVNKTICTGKYTLLISPGRLRHFKSIFQNSFMAIITQVFISKSRPMYNQRTILLLAGLMHTRDGHKETFRPAQLTSKLKEVNICFYYLPQYIVHL